MARLGLTAGPSRPLAARLADDEGDVPNIVRVERGRRMVDAMPADFDGPIGSHQFAVHPKRLAGRGDRAVGTSDIEGRRLFTRR